MSMHRGFTRLLGAVAAMTASALLAGCGLSLEDVPLPSVVKGPTYQVTAVFENALGLPDQADVKLDGARVGEVTKVEADGYTARVSMKIKTSVPLPADTRAEIQFTSPMGEAFVAMVPPVKADGAPLADGAVIGLKATNAAPSATDLLATLSTVVSGGTFADLSIIVKQLTVALEGNTGNVRSIIADLNGTLQGLNAHTATFDRSLDHLKTLTTDLAADRQLLSQAIASFDPAVRTLRSQTDQALALMSELRKLSASGQQTIKAGRAHMLSVARTLSPILDTLTRNADTFPKIFDGIGTFGRASDGVGYGLFANFDLTTIFEPSALIGGLPQ